MKKIVGYLLLLIIIITSCEKDDFCTQNPVTPKLFLKFYDDTDRESTKKVERLSIIAEQKEDSLFTDETIDSILTIPLNTAASQTIYTLKMNNVDGNTANNQIAKLTITYETEEKFVSRSCGFKIIFDNVSFDTDTNTWIKDFTANTTIIENEDAAHVQIFH